MAPYLEGLLPDNDGVLERWARRFHVSPRNPFALLAHMGEDCAGAVQIVRPDRYDDVTRLDEVNVDWLDEEGVAERLRDLVDHHGTGRLPADRGQFSLAGAQPKMALLRDGERWGIPAGPTASTHILKPPALRDFDAFDVNEHFCLKLASETGLAVAGSSVRTFAGQAALVVERYDRVRDPDGRFVRLHQEDVCQALAVSPLRKYQNEGGPGPADVVNLLVRECDDPDADVGAFLDALVLNWIIAGTDAHAKNYSIMLSARSVRLAPFYDLISVLPYPRQVHPREARLAMSVDREYQLRKIRRRHWEGLAARCELDPEPVIERATELVETVPAAATRAADTVRDEGLDHDIIDTLVASISEQAERCLRVLSSVLLAALLIGSRAGADAQIVTGRVVEHDTDRPIVAATISVFDDDESIASSESDSTGFFRLLLPLSGEYRIRVERLGYAPAETEAIEVGRTEIVEVEISLRVDAVEIEPIMVVTRRTMAPSSEYHRRLEEGLRTGFGRFITRAQLDSTGAADVTSLLLRVPFVGMGADSAGRFTPVMLSRGGCVPTLYLNGMRWTAGYRELDVMLLPNSLEGVEIYRSRSELPADLVGCGAIAFWTREGEPTRGGFWRFILAGGAALGVLFIFLAR